MDRRSFIGAGCCVVFGSGCVGNTTTTGNPESFTDISCPPFSREVDTYVCSHTESSTSDEVGISVTPEKAPVSEFKNSIQITIQNEADTKIEMNPYSWSMYKYDDNEWVESPPTTSGNGIAIIEPGQIKQWKIAEIIQAIMPDGEFSSGIYTVVNRIDTKNSSDCFAIFELE